MLGPSSVVVVVALALATRATGTTTTTTTAITDREGKLDDRGNFLPLRGVNVIAFVEPSTETSRAIDALQRFVSTDPLITALYAPLPRSHLHMTLHPLITEREARDLWGTRAFDSALARMRRGLESLSSSLQSSPIRVTPTVQSFGIGRTVLAIRLSLSREDVVKVGRLWRSVERDLGIDAGQVKGKRGSIDPERGTYQFHLTLGYLLPTRNASRRDELMRQAQRRTASDLSAILRPGSVLELGAAVLCAFENITVFEPLEARHFSGNAARMGTKWEPPALDYSAIRAPPMLVIFCAIPAILSVVIVVTLLRRRHQQLHLSYFSRAFTKVH